MLLGVKKAKAQRLLGEPCAELQNGPREVRLWRVSRVLAIRAGLPFPAPDEPLTFWTANGITKRIREMVSGDIQRHRVADLLGEPDARLVTPSREDPLWSSESISAVFVLVSESPSTFTRERAFKCRVSAKRRQFLQRMQSRQPGWWKVSKKPVVRGRIVPARHRWAVNG